MKTSEIMLELVRSTVFESEISADTLEKIGSKLGEGALEELYKLSKAHDIDNLVGAALQKYFLISPKDSEISSKLCRSKLIAAFRCDKIEREIDIILDTLENAEIDHIPLKGAVIRKLYPEEWMRTSCDIDVLVREKDLDKAISTITEKLKYTVAEQKDYNDISLFSPSGIHLELHFSLKERVEKFNEVISLVWDNSNLTDGKKHSYRQTNEFLLFHIIAHAAKHFIHGGCGVRSFVDMFVIKQKISIDESNFNNLIEKSDLTVFNSMCDKICHYWFDADNSNRDIYYEESLSDMENYILSGGTYGTVYNRITVTRKKGKLRYTLSRIFMPYDMLKTEYPILERHKILFPFYQVLRWLRVFNRRKVKTLQKEIEFNNSIENSQVERMQRLFSELGFN